LLTLASWSSPCASRERRSCPFLFQTSMGCALFTTPSAPVFTDHSSLNPDGDYACINAIGQFTDPRIFAQSARRVRDRLLQAGGAGADRGGESDNGVRQKPVRPASSIIISSRQPTIVMRCQARLRVGRSDRCGTHRLQPKGHLTLPRRYSTRSWSARAR